MSQVVLAVACARAGCRRTTTHPGGMCHDHRMGAAAHAAPLVAPPEIDFVAIEGPRGQEVVDLKIPMSAMPPRAALPIVLADETPANHRGGAKYFDIRGRDTEAFEVRLAEVGAREFLYPRATRSEVAVARDAGWDAETHAHWARWGVDVATAQEYTEAGVDTPEGVYAITRMTQPLVTPEHIEAMDLPKDPFGRSYGAKTAAGILAEAERKAVAAGAERDLEASAAMFAAGWDYEHVPALRAGGVTPEQALEARRSGMTTAEQVLTAHEMSAPYSWAATGA